MDKRLYNDIKKRIDWLEAVVNGGKGSGNFGHAGRPGEVGGSAPGGSGGVSAKDAKAAEKKAQKAYDDYTDKHGFDQSEEAHALYRKYTDAKKATRLAEQKELYAKTPKAKELVDGEQEMHDIVDKYGKYETSTKAGQIITKLDDFSHTFEADTEGFYSRKNKDLTKKVLDHTQELQKIAKDIASDKKLSKSDKATLIDSVAALYSTLGSSIYSGGKFRADDDFTSGKTWVRLDSSDSLKGATKQYAKKLRDLGDSTYDIYKAKESGGKYYSWSDLLDKNSLQDRLENEIKSIDLLLNGGKGSGNFGHAGRPGEVGGSSKGSGGSGIDPNQSDEERTGEHTISNKILERKGLNLDAKKDVVYFNSESHKSSTYYYREKNEDGEWVDKTGTQEYDYGTIQFGESSKNNSSDSFSISGNRRYSGKAPSRNESYKWQVVTNHPYNKAEYYWAGTNDGKTYNIIRDGKKESQYVAKNSGKGGSLAVPCELLEKITNLNKSVEKIPTYD